MWGLQFTGYLFALLVFYNKKMDRGGDRRLFQDRENAFLRASCHLSYPRFTRNKGIWYTWILFPFSLLTSRKYDMYAGPHCISIRLGQPAMSRR